MNWKKKQKAKGKKKVTTKKKKNSRKLVIKKVTRKKKVAVKGKKKIKIVKKIKKIVRKQKKVTKDKPSALWNFGSVWNNSLRRMDKHKYEKRNHLWASELGKAPIDLYLKLRGVKPSNPPDSRTLRKFEAGNVFEWIVSLILKRAGILREQQTRFEHQYKGMLKVTGKCDFIAGGKPDYKKAIAEIDEMDLPDVFKRATKAIMQHLKTAYPGGLVNKPIEIKSVSRIVFDGLEAKSRAMKHHRMQLFHYMKTGKYKAGHVVYICRDDLRMIEIEVLNPGPVENEYKAAIKQISNYVMKNEKPLKEEYILFNEDTGRFERNWNVAYSPYLKMLYGFKHQQVFDDSQRGIVSRFNRVLGRAKRKEKMTEKNLAVIKEIGQKGFNWKRCVDAAAVLEENGEE